MNEALQAFLDGHLPIEGVVAWSARLADRSVASKCNEDWLSAAQMEQALNQLAGTAENLRKHKIEPTRLCSVFENLRIHLSLGENGTCLALFVENRPTESTDALERLLEEYRALAF